MKNDQKTKMKVVKEVADVEEANVVEDVQVEETQIGNEGPRADKVLQIKLDDVNQFIGIIGVVMLDDPRNEVLQKHFINIVKANNPELKDSK